MTFAQAYSELEDKFKSMVDLDNRCHDIKSVFLPNVEPTGRWIMSSWGWNQGYPDAIRTSRLRGRRSPMAKCENWGRCPQTSTLVFAVWKYLCDEDKATYYFTDLAHGSMKAGSKGTKDPSKYERWFPLLKEELALVAKPNAKIISIGNTVSKFLAEKGSTAIQEWSLILPQWGWFRGQGNPSPQKRWINSSEIRPRKIRISSKEGQQDQDTGPARNWCLTT